MDTLSRIGYVFVALLILIPMMTAMFNFFGITTAIYLPYLGWGIALALFYAFLPKTVGSMFD